MTYTVVRRSDPTSVDRVLRSLPSWFGIEEAIEQYVSDAAALPSYLAVDDSGLVIGIALVNQHFAESAEVHLLAVVPDVHRHGVGRMLISAVQDDLLAAGTALLAVHTVGPSYEDEGYAKTREFYRAVGFIPLQEIVGIDWDGPTLIMVKRLG